MITIRKTSRYNKQRDKFVRNNLQRGNALIKTIDKFTHNPNHPSLNLEKLGGSKYWSIRIDRGNRIFFVWLNSNTVCLLYTSPSPRD